MPQHTQHSLIHVLLLWITILSIVQVTFIIFFFTAGRSQNSSAVAPARTMHIQANNTTLSPSTPGPLLGKGKMLSFKAQTTEVNRKIKWEATTGGSTSLVSEEEEGEVLKIKKDGYYFLNLQVTLSSCNKTQKLQHTVSLESNNEVILMGWINTNTCSTGLLNKVEELTASSILEVTINHTTNDETINDAKYLTHLDIIYINRP